MPVRPRARSFDLVTDDPLAGSCHPPESHEIRLQTSDGVEVVADLWMASRAWAGAAVCHPHPAYGGDRHNVVVDRIFQTLVPAGMTALRFDFRRGSDGASGEQRDVVAAVERVAEHLGTDLPLWLVGYSFGADGDDKCCILQAKGHRGTDELRPPARSTS